MSDVEAPRGGRADYNRANWRTAPFNEAAFQNVSSLLPVARIAAGTTARPFEGEAHSLDEFSLTAPAGAEIDFQGFLSRTHTDALVVLWNGRLVQEVYRNSMTARTPHIFMSATKAVIGLLAGVLVGEGVIALDSPVEAYVPEVAATLYGGATLRDLLHMRAGAALGPEDQAAYDHATNWGAAAAGARPASLHDFFAGLRGPPARHGGAFHYDSANTDLLGWAFERATGQTCAELLSTRLWRPLGAEYDAYITLDDAGAARCTGGFCATARDMARLGQLILDRGAANGVQVVPEDWVDQVALGGDQEAWRTGEWGRSFAAISRDMSYRAGWYALNDATRSLFAMGIYGQNIFVDPTNKLVVAKLSSLPVPMDYQAVGLNHWAFGEIRRLLLQRQVS